MKRRHRSSYKPAVSGQSLRCKSARVRRQLPSPCTVSPLSQRDIGTAGSSAHAFNRPAVLQECGGRWLENGASQKLQRQWSRPGTGCSACSCTKIAGCSNVSDAPYTILSQRARGSCVAGWIERQIMDGTCWNLGTTVSARVQGRSSLNTPRTVPAIIDSHSRYCAHASPPPSQLVGLPIGKERGCRNI